MSSAAYSADVHLVPEVVVLGIDHGLGSGGQVVAVGDENSLVLVHGAHAYLNDGGIGCAAGHVVGHDLQHIADLHTQQIQHAGMKSLGLEVYESGLLTGVSSREELYDLLFNIKEPFIEVLEGLGLAAHDGLVYGGINQNLVAHVELHVAEFIHAPVV